MARVGLTDRDKNPVTIKAGFRTIYEPNTGCLVICDNEGVDVLWNGHDNKRLIRLKGVEDFFSLVDMIACIHKLRVRQDSDNPWKATFY